MAKHARLSASNAERWMTCPGSVPLTEHLPRESSSYADEGTAAHFLAAECLEHKVDTKAFAGRTIALCKDLASGDHFEQFEDKLAGHTNYKVTNTIHVGQDMVRYVQKYLDDVRRVALSMNGEILVEQRLSIAFLTGEEDAESTADAVILGVHPETKNPTIITVDLKYGQGEVVSAVDNKQLRMYGSAAREQYGMLDDYNHFHNVIHQPRVNAFSEEVVKAEVMDAFEQEVRQAAERVREATITFEAKGDMTPFLKASEKGCRWCKHNNCETRTKFVEDAVGASMEDLTALADKDVAALAKPESDPPTKDELETLSMRMKAVPLIEGWMKAIRAQVEAFLFAGVAVPDYKLVEGKLGHRKWADEDAAAKLLRSKLKLKADDVYTKSLISPTQAEKLLDDPAKYAVLEAVIVQNQGQPSVAPASDKRPPYTPPNVDDEMQDLTESEEDLLGV